jgi:hypothetical protein
MSGSTYPTPEFTDVIIPGIGSVKLAIQEGGGSGGEITPEELEAVWSEVTTTGGEW